LKKKIKAAVKAGSPTVMINSGEVNGVPGHINSFYINDILKGELKFDGFVVSDWEDIVRLHIRDGIAETPEEAVRMSVMAGLDMSMVPFSYSFYGHCVNLAKKDAKFLERATDATKRILKVKDQLGLFDNADPLPGQINMIGSVDSENFNLEAAKESIILAKNDGSLPLDKLSSKKILVTGATGNLVKVLNGGWSYTWQGENENNFNTFGRPKKTLFKAIQDKVSNPVNVKYVQGVDFNERTNFDEAINEAKAADIIILAVGEDTYTETPGNIDSLLLNHQQYELANELFKLNKQVVVVYIGGRPRVMTSIDQGGNATLIAFLPGKIFNF
jgi:beta-glucosidase